MSIKIVIIEDEKEITDVVSFALKRAGMSCEYAQTAQQGLSLLKTLPCDLLILDVGLPDMDGFEVLKIIRRQYQLPVIMLTAQNEEVDRILGLELGADDYIGKPFSPRELVARVKTVLKRCGDSTDTDMHDKEMITMGEFIFDKLGQRVLFREQVLPLTLAEFKIFTYMLAHPQQVFSRTQLLSAAFAVNHPSDLRTVDTHIKSLRHKLREAGCGSEVIITHRALGYSVQP